MNQGVVWTGNRQELQVWCQQYAQAVTPDVFVKKLTQFVCAATDNLKQGAWHEQCRPDENFLDANAVGYDNAAHDVDRFKTPFAQKIIVGEHAKIAVIADVHGDLYALGSVLTELIEAGYLDQRLRILTNDFYLVFLGDYVNREAASIPVMALLFDLFVTNPGNVFLCRGNHEDAYTCTRFQARLREQQSQGKFQEHVTLLDQLRDFIPDYVFPQLLHWFEYLPHAVFVGNRNGKTDKVEYQLFTHGGLELGWNPHDFLADEQSNFQLLTKLDRLHGMHELVSEQSRKHLEQECQQLWTEHERFDLIGQQGVIDFCKPQSFYSLRFGGCWNDFLTEQFGAELATISYRRKVLIWGKAMSWRWFERASSRRVAVRGVIRGHQHLDEQLSQLNGTNNMRERIVVGKGMVRQWDGTVYTLATASHIAHMHSFVLISAAHGWSLRHYFKKPDKPAWSFHVRSLWD